MWKTTKLQNMHCVSYFSGKWGVLGLTYYLHYNVLLILKGFGNSRDRVLHWHMVYPVLISSEWCVAFSPHAALCQLITDEIQTKEGCWYQLRGIQRKTKYYLQNPEDIPYWFTQCPAFFSRCVSPMLLVLALLATQIPTEFVSQERELDIFSLFNFNGQFSHFCHSGISSSSSVLLCPKHFSPSEDVMLMV